MNPAPLILASSSAYRRELLARLRLPFECIAPALDETPQPGETVAATCARLAQAKAAAVAASHPQACIVASDQLASLSGRPMGKPQTPDKAREQLQAASGRTLVFHTALRVQSPEGGWSIMDETRVRFRELSAEAIRRYVEREPALDCAGAFKAEGLGISLFDTIDSHDPTALIGLPLIATARLLRRAGYALP